MISRSKQVVAALFLFAAMAFGAAASQLLRIETRAAAQVQSAKKWETMVVRGGSSPEGLQGVLNMRGDEGWELVQVIEIKDGYVAYMKRAK